MGIVRIDSAATHGWQVRLYRDGKTRTKFFADKKHGGRDPAQELAVSFASQAEAEMAEQPGKPAARRLVRRAADADDAAGITRTAKRDKRGIPHEVYSVTWRPEPGVRKCTSFSIKRYGEADAFERACQLRWERMREIYGERYAVASPEELFGHKDAVDQAAEDRLGR